MYTGCLLEFVVKNILVHEDYAWLSSKSDLGLGKPGPLLGLLQLLLSLPELGQVEGGDLLRLLDLLLVRLDLRLQLGS